VEGGNAPAQREHNSGKVGSKPIKRSSKTKPSSNQSNTINSTTNNQATPTSLLKQSTQPYCDAAT
jgi:hypothetical protein